MSTLQARLLSREVLPFYLSLLALAAAALLCDAALHLLDAVWVGRWLGIHSLAEGRIAMRAEAGAVLARETARIPATELFRTGGDTSVRGYSLREIGIALAGKPGVVGPGHYLGVASVQWQRPIRGSNGLLTEWENTFFIDAGGVTDKLKDARPSVGIGTGVRWKSPIGPLQIDLAYGVKARQFRLHTSVGFVF